MAEFKYTDIKYTDDSDALSFIIYNENTQKLGVQYKDTGRVYFYENVGKDTWEAFKAASSAGGFNNTKIKGKFPSAGFAEKFTTAWTVEKVKPAPVEKATPVENEYHVSYRVAGQTYVAVLEAADDNAVIEKYTEICKALTLDATLVEVTRFFE